MVILAPNASMDDTEAFTFGLSAGTPPARPVRHQRWRSRFHSSAAVLMPGDSDSIQCHVGWYSGCRLRFEEASAALSGGGSLVSRVASPGGIVNFGPHNLTTVRPTEYNRVSGVLISGAGCRTTTFKTLMSVRRGSSSWRALGGGVAVIRTPYPILR